MTLRSSGPIRSRATLLLTVPARIQRCDTIIFLDLPRLLCMGRIAKRRLLNHNRSRPDMGEGCPEKLNWSFIKWIWNYKHRSRPKTVKLLNEISGTKQIVWLRSRAEVRRFLNGQERSGNRIEF